MTWRLEVSGIIMKKRYVSPHTFTHSLNKFGILEPWSTSLHTVSAQDMSYITISCNKCHPFVVNKYDYCTLSGTTPSEQ